MMRVRRIRIENQSPVITTRRSLTLIILLATAPVMAGAAEPLSLDLTIKEHRFEPAELKVAAGTPFVIRIRNFDSTPEEFESHALRIEKVVAGQGEGVVRSQGLDPGRYEFVGEFHADTAKGVLIVETKTP